MIGWNIIIYKVEQQAESEKRERVASWLVGLGGTDWLDELVKEGKARVVLFNGGYPTTYSAKWSELLPRLSGQPEPYKGTPIIGEDYVMLPGWAGTMQIDEEVLSRCSPDEEMIIDAWDQS